jgi:hypothetical protein
LMNIYYWTNKMGFSKNFLFFYANLIFFFKIKNKTQNT